MIDHATEEEVRRAAASLEVLRAVLGRVLFGQEEVIDTVVVGLLSSGHILLEGLPGLGKTALVKALAHALDLTASRIQFTPDLLPGDITGNPILQEVDGRRAFVFEPGPLFGNIVLADEVNRASPKTQSALLEAMQERRVTVLGRTHVLPDPFFVLATQNPIELEGTYPLPEAQLDRFLFKVEIHGNSVPVLEKIVTERQLGVEPEMERALSRDDLGRLIALSRRIYVPEAVANYIARLVDATHPGRSSASAGVKFGASPRAALGLAAGARSRALLSGRMNAGFEDARAVAPAVLRHRIILDYNARLDGSSTAGVVDAVLEEVPFQARELPSTLSRAKHGTR